MSASSTRGKITYPKTEDSKGTTLLNNLIFGKEEEWQPDHFHPSVEFEEGAEAVPFNQLSAFETDTVLTKVVAAVKKRDAVTLKVILDSLETKISLSQSLPLGFASGLTLFGFALLQGDLECIQLLLNQTDSEIDFFSLISNTNDINSVYHLVAVSGSIEVARLLLNRKGCELNMRNSLGQTPLDISIERGWSDLVEFFVHNNSTFLTLPGMLERSVSLARTHGRLKIALWLREYEIQSIIDTLETNSIWQTLEHENKALILTWIYFLSDQTSSSSVSSSDLPCVLPIEHQPIYCLFSRKLFESNGLLFHAQAILTIHFALGLKSADINGLSDPYVKVRHPEHPLFNTPSQRGTLHRTPIFFKTLNPTFEFSVLLHDLFPGDVITLDIFDHDTIGRDDFIGRAILSLAPSSPLISIDHLKLELLPRFNQPDHNITGTISISLTFSPESTFLTSASSFHEPSVFHPDARVEINRPMAEYYLDVLDYRLFTKRYLTESIPPRTMYVDAEVVSHLFEHPSPQISSLMQGTQAHSSS